MLRFFRYNVLIHRRRIQSSLRKWVFSFVGSFLGISLVFFFHKGLKALTHTDQVMLIGSFGASAVIIFGTPQSPYAMPRHAIGGHLISALVGVMCYTWLGRPEWLWSASALAVALAVIIMQITRTIHPPGGATALIAVMGSDKIHELKFLYLLTPVFSGILVLLGTASVLHVVKRYIQ